MTAHSTPVDELTGEVLEETPEKATRYLTGMARSAALRQILFEKITDALLAEGRELLVKTITVPRAVPSPDAEKDPQVVRRRRALAELNDTDEDLLTEIDGVLTRFNPQIRDYVVGDLHASTDPAVATHNIEQVLARITALADGTDPAREATRELDRKAVVLLASRNVLTAERREGLEKSCNLATSPAPVIPVPVIDITARHQALVDLKLWLNEVSAITRANVKKSLLLELVGLAHPHARPHRKRPSKNETPVPKNTP